MGTHMMRCRLARANVMRPRSLHLFCCQLDCGKVAVKRCKYSSIVRADACATEASKHAVPERKGQIFNGHSRLQRWMQRLTWRQQLLQMKGLRHQRTCVWPGCTAGQQL